MSFNFGVAGTGIAQSYTARLAYLYESTAYRRWITDIAIAFYTGRQDEFVWYDLKRQFRHPDKQQIIPYNLTKEIIEETAILYREEPVYLVKNKEGKTLADDTKLWARIRKDGRYHNVCQQLDAMCKLLGTVLVRISFIDPVTGDLVNENKPGTVQFELVYGGSYDARWNSSPYYLSELDFGYTESYNKLSSMGTVTNIPMNPNLSVAMKPGQQEKRHNKVDSLDGVNLDKISKIHWSLKDHKVEDADGNMFEGENPYGCIPAVPFFDHDPGNRYFLPVNEPLLYANHAINMRLSDLNHVAKFQSFGQAVVKGVERPINNRLGRPVDDFNMKGGSRSFGFGASSSNVGPSGLNRDFNDPFGYFGDGNALPNMNGFSLGPDTVVTLGETGEFKYEQPGADIKGLVSTIYTMMDMVRINHGLRAKHNSSLPPSGFAVLAEKVGVIERNKRRAILFREREQQLFQIVKKLWNIHHAEEKGAELFSEEAELEVHYVEPEFVTDPTTKMNALKQEQEILMTGNTELIKKVYPHLDDAGVANKLKQFHKDRMQQAERDVEIENYKAENMVISESEQETETSAKPRIQDRAKHARESSVQPGKNGDTRKTDKARRRDEQKS